MAESFFPKVFQIQWYTSSVWIWKKFVTHCWNLKVRKNFILVVTAIKYFAHNIISRRISKVFMLKHKNCFAISAQNFILLWTLWESTCTEFIITKSSRATFVTTRLPGNKKWRDTNWFMTTKLNARSAKNASIHFQIIFRLTNQKFRVLFVIKCTTLVIWESTWDFIERTNAKNVMKFLRKKTTWDSKYLKICLFV